MSLLTCQKCGQDAIQAGERGAYLKRINPKGEKGIFQCVPTCEHKHGGPNGALLGALRDNAKKEDQS